MKKYSEFVNEAKRTLKSKLNYGLELKPNEIKFWYDLLIKNWKKINQNQFTDNEIESLSEELLEKLQDDYDETNSLFTQNLVVNNYFQLGKYSIKDFHYDIIRHQKQMIEYENSITKTLECIEDAVEFVNQYLEENKKTI